MFGTPGRPTTGLRAYGKSPTPSFSSLPPNRNSSANLGRVANVVAFVLRAAAQRRAAPSSLPFLPVIPDRVCRPVEPFLLFFLHSALVALPGALYL